MTSTELTPADIVIKKFILTFHSSLQTRWQVLNEIFIQPSYDYMRWLDNGELYIKDEFVSGDYFDEMFLKSRHSKKVLINEVATEFHKRMEAFFLKNIDHIAQEMSTLDYEPFLPSMTIESTKILDIDLMDSLLYRAYQKKLKEPEWQIVGYWKDPILQIIESMTLTLSRNCYKHYLESAYDTKNPDNWKDKESFHQYQTLNNIKYTLFPELVGIEKKREQIAQKLIDEIILEEKK